MHKVSQTTDGISFRLNRQFACNDASKTKPGLRPYILTTVHWTSSHVKLLPSLCFSAIHVLIVNMIDRVSYIYM